MRFKTNWASLIVGTKYTVLALFYFVFEGIFQVYIWRGDLTEGFFALPVWGAYHVCKGLFSEFYGISGTTPYKDTYFQPSPVK